MPNLKRISSVNWMLLLLLFLVEISIPKVESSCLTSDIDRNIDRVECSDNTGTPIIPNNENIPLKVPIGSICFVGCLGGEGVAFWKKCADDELWDGPPIQCNTGKIRYVDKKKERPKRGWIFGRRRRSPPPPPPNTAPVMQNCPTLSNLYTAGHRVTYAIVRWTAPVAHDKEQGYIGVSQTSGAASGSRFYEGTHTITYTARDNRGATASCSRSFRVHVVVCGKPRAPTYGTISCSGSRLIYGSTCTYTCRSGYSISGPGTVSCASSGRFSSTSTTCVDVTPPVFTSCPATQTIFAGRNERTAAVSWPSITASDNSGGVVTITQTNGPTKGASLTAGHYQIEHNAVDSAGQKSQPCVFTVIVKVTRCTEPDKNYMNFTCTTDDFLFGTTCNLSCDHGYNLVGTNTLTCEQTTPPSDVGQWDGSPQPSCTKVRCRQLNTPLYGAVDCTDDTLEWGASCTITCDNGFRLMGPRELTCTKDGVFDIALPRCVDNVPPVFDSCPSPITVYATRNMRRATAAWTRPHATDNLGNVTVTQTKGYRSGLLFNSGTTQIYFDAIDEAGNKATACIFTVTVNLIKCALPDLKDDFLGYQCSESDYLFGTVCGLTCPDGMIVDGSDKIICESRTPKTREGTWVLNKETEPRCFKEIKCSKLPPPQNGVLVCEAYSGVCQIQCNSFHDSNRIYTEKDDVMFVCGSSGMWIPNSAIFDCSETKSRRQKLPSEFFYFSSQCQNETAKRTISSNFEGAFLKSSFGRGCGGRCTFDQLYVHCG